jgi:type II secretion system protein N
MAKWMRGIAYFLWGILCFLIFFYVFFPYEALGRRILSTLSEKSSLNFQPSDTRRSLLGVRWPRVDVSSPKQMIPSVEVEDWTIRLRPLPCLIGHFILTTRGKALAGSFQADLSKETEGYHASLAMDGVRIERLRHPQMKQFLLGGVIGGKAEWKMAGPEVNGSATFTIRNGRIENLSLSGFVLPLLDVGAVKGQIAWVGDKIDLNDVTIDGKDIKGSLTGKVLLRNPLPMSKLECRMGITPAGDLMNRYPLTQTFLGQGQGKTSRLDLAIQGTFQAPQISLSK